MSRERHVRVVNTKTKAVSMVPSGRAAELLKSKDFREYSNKMVAKAPKKKGGKGGGKKK